MGLNTTTEKINDYEGSKNKRYGCKQIYKLLISTIKNDCSALLKGSLYQTCRDSQYDQSVACCADIAGTMLGMIYCALQCFTYKGLCSLLVLIAAMNAVTVTHDKAIQDNHQPSYTKKQEYVDTLSCCLQV